MKVRALIVCVIGATLASAADDNLIILWRDTGTRQQASFGSSAPQGEGTDDMDEKNIYHYTFGVEYTLSGVPVVGGVIFAILLVVLAQIPTEGSGGQVAPPPLPTASQIRAQYEEAGALEE